MDFQVGIVLSGRGMVFDIEALRHSVRLCHPEAVVFFFSSLGKLQGGGRPPRKMDLLIDLTAPGQRERLGGALGWRFYAKRVVGRRHGWLRGLLYDEVHPEAASQKEFRGSFLPLEREMQEAVLRLAGIPPAQSGELLSGQIRGH